MSDLTFKLQVASFGDYFADKRISRGATTPRVKKVEVARREPSRAPQEPPANPAWEIKINNASPATQKESQPTEAGTAHSKPQGSTSEIECLTYKDPFSFVYKKYGLLTNCDR